MSKWGNIPPWAYDAALSIMQSLKLSDPETYYHCCRVGEASRKLAKSAGLNEYEQKIAEFSGLFHDVGKIGVDKSIIHKPGKLDAAETEKMKEHPILSVKIIQPLSDDAFFKDLVPGVKHHHERIDGLGYPDRIIGDAIPLISRVILIVDTYDAMTQNRAYRKGLPIDVVYAELKRFAGTQFDEQLVRIFLESHPTWNKLDADEETISKLITRVA
jgi:HD-GYP domain-containing protein (c-di-GMP phosphodiesterase class II)